MSSIVLIAGTDTGVGKTWVGCALARALRRAGRGVIAIKPVESGCEPADRSQEDGVLLARATGQSAPARALIRLRAPLTPALAAELEGVTIDPPALTAEITRLAAGVDITLVESAGGLLAPITWRCDALDLARALGAGAVLVASDRLGTINHVLLSLRALGEAGVPLLGLVLTAPAAPDPSTGTNAAVIARVTGIERVCTVPRIGDSREAERAVAGPAAWLAPSSRGSAHDDSGTGPG